MANTQAIAIARTFFPGLERYLPPGLAEVRDLQALLDQLELAEREGQAAYDKLLTARRNLYDRPIDYVIYRKLQDDLLRAQSMVIAGVCRMAGPLAPQVAALMPRPAPLPSLTYRGQARTQAGTRGLGILQVVAAIIAVLAALGLLYLLSDEIEAMINDLATVFVARARAAQQHELLEARRTAFEACRARGGTGPECLEEAERLAPTPAEAGTEIEGPGGGGGAPGSLRTIGLGVLGLLVVGGIGYGVAKVWGVAGRRGMSGYAGVPVRSVSGARPSAVGDLDGSKSRYYLEV